MIKANEIKIVPIKEIKLNPKNRNKHPSDQIERLSKIIEYQGFRNPLIISSRTGLVVAGHGRYEAAKKLKLKEVPVMIQDFENEEQEYAAQVSDNAIAAWAELDLSGINTDLGDLGPDFDIDLLGIKGFEIEPADRDLGDEDAIPENVEPKTKLGDIYQLGNHRLMCGDSTAITDVDTLMEGNTAEVCLTDPPYGIAYQSNYRKDKFDVLTNDEVILKEWAGVAQAVVQSWVIFFCGWQRLKEWLEVGEQFGPLTNILVWRKSAAMGDLNGSFSPTYELALAYNRGGKLGGTGRPSAVIEQNIDDGNSFEHPTQKPVALFEKLLQHLPDGSVLDLFGGSGSTLIACEKTNRKCFMMELDPHYCDVIVARWEKYTGQKADLIGG